MPSDVPDESPPPLRVQIVGTSTPDESQGGGLRRDALLIVLSVVLSGAVAFEVAQYTVDRNNGLQRRLAAQQQLSAVYIPLRLAEAGVIACVAPNLCSVGELLRADRAENQAAVAAIGPESTRVGDLQSALDESLKIIVSNRLRGQRSSAALLRLAGSQSAALDEQISKELAVVGAGSLSAP